MDYNNDNGQRIWDEWISDEALGISFDKEGLKKRSSSVHLSLFFYLLISYAVVFAASLIGVLALPEDVYMKIFGSGVFNILLSIGAQYLIAFPIFILIMRRGSKPTPVEGRKMPFRELALLTLIAEALMLFGSMIGNFIAGVFAGIFGDAPSNSLDEVLSDTPIWLMIVSVVILAPIVEEIIFRKMIIDRLAPYGGAMAVMISSIAFMLIHANVYQFPYALMVGIVLGYVYIRSGNVKYTIAIHMIMNFLGSVATIPVQDASVKLLEIFDVMEAGGELELVLADYLPAILIVAAYSIIQFALMVGGIAALVAYARQKRSEAGELFPHGSEAFRAAYVSVGAILFIAVSLIMTATTFFV